VNPKDTSTIGMLKYAPQLHLSKDVAAAYVIGRRALGYEEKLPKGYEVLLRDERVLRPRPGVLRKPPPGTPKAQGGGKEPLPQAEAFPRDGEGPPSAFPPFELSRPSKGPEGEPSGLFREPEGVYRRKEPLRRPSLESPEGRPILSPSRARGAERSLAPRAHPTPRFADPGIVEGVEDRLRSSSWWGAGAH
jgi:hypothetical protein